MKKVNVVDLIKYLNNEFNYENEVSLKDFESGNGVYSIVIGSRGYIEEISKVEDFKLRSKEEILDLYDNEEDRNDVEEFVDVGEIEWNDLGGVYENLSEEDMIEYYDVVI